MSRRGEVPENASHISCTSGFMCVRLHYTTYKRHLVIRRTKVETSRDGWQCWPEEAEGLLYEARGRRIVSEIRKGTTEFIREFMICDGR